jgi:hypothetical protein
VPAVAAAEVETVLKVLLEESAVRQAGQGVQEGRLLQLVEALDDRDALGVVAKALDGADESGGGAAQRRGAEADGDAVAVLVMEVDLGLETLGAAEDGPQGAPSLAEQASLAIHVAEKVVGARRAEHLLARVARDPLGTLVPERNRSVGVYNVNAV